MISVADHELAALWQQIKGGRMNYKLWIVLWLAFSTSIIDWDINRHKDISHISVCHNAEIRMMNDRPMCTECKLYCEVANEKR